MNITLNQPVETAASIALHPVKGVDDPYRVVPSGSAERRSYDVYCDASLPQGELCETLRRAAYDLCRQAHAEKHAVLQVDAVGLDVVLLLAFVEGIQLADYSFDRYKSKEPFHIARLDIRSRKLNAAQLETYRNLWNRIFWCREWVNLPVADLNATRFADELQAVASDMKISCEVYDKKAIEKLGMGGLLGVNRGSVDEPRLVVLEYDGAGNNRTKPVVLVGKGVMYDTGGLNIKPDDYMQEMKSDMAGAATMASVLFAAADNRLPVHLVAVLPLTDNRPGFNAYAADDILTMYDGTTVEIINTDAEGRLILADAIAYAVQRFQPSLLIDAATLTGAAVRAISTFGIAAVQQFAEGPMATLKTVGEAVHQRIAELPFWKEYDELLRSDVADLKNCGPAQAGTITAGKFLARFAGQTPYIHLDIAGVAYFGKPQSPYGFGASGYGIRLLYDYLQSTAVK
ncbi:MAG: leucyl aminopeptidase [bacterium P3]|nr:MAG: leucyl aminopeptidase [bacterium P3]KWW41822.1 MAG: leucyl aminopeptidase [bacterium F083]